MDFRKTEKEIEDVRKILAEERQVRSKEKDSNELMLKGGGQVELMSLDRCNEMVARVRELEQRLYDVNTKAALKQDQVARLNRELEDQKWN